MPTHIEKAFSPEERAGYKQDIESLCGIIGIVGVLELTAEIAEDYAAREAKDSGDRPIFPQQKIAQWLHISAIISRAYDEVLEFLNRD